jgi:small subunit ribosomal protein S20
MPNTKSAERRTRSNARKETRNRGVKSRIKTLTSRYTHLAQEGKKSEASEALRAVSSALDKAAKSGVLHSSTASRKKSRLAVRLNSLN